MDESQDKVFASLAEVATGGRYIEREDGTIVRAPAEGGPGLVVGATSGEAPALPEVGPASAASPLDASVPAKPKKR